MKRCGICGNQRINGKCYALNSKNEWVAYTHSEEKIKAAAIAKLDYWRGCTNCNYKQRKNLNKLAKRYNYDYEWKALGK